ncbi:MAG: response regulator [Aquabacterium sp.]|nr:MAG: response regulator [Aquabacterium sp.]
MKALRLSLQQASPADTYIWRTYLVEQWRGFLWGAPGQAAGLTCIAWLIHRWPVAPAVWIAPLAAMAVLWLAVGLLARQIVRVAAAGTDYDYPRWRAMLLVAACLQSGVWGGMIFTVLPVAMDPWRAILVISILVFAYTAMVFAMNDFGMMLAGVVPCMLPLLLRLGVDGREEDVYLIAVVVFSLVTCLLVGRVVSGKLLDADRLRAEKMLLAEQLQIEIRNATEARELAEAADRQKSEFFAAASHDLRQPLHALMLLTGHLRSSLGRAQARGTPVDPAATLNVAGKINQALGSLSLMFEKMFDVARIDAHKVINQPRACSVRGIFDTLDNEFSVLCAEKGLAWRVDANADWVLADPLLAERVLRNFLNNAVRYTTTGSVRLRARRRGAMLVLQVWDSGHGVAREHRGRIFEDYFQAENPARHLSEGLGLGLAVVRRLARLAGWPVQLRSRVGRGSCFSISLPLTMPPHAATTGEDAVASVPAPAAPAPPERPLLLLLDDDRAVLDAMEGAMSDLGWQVACGTTLAEAIAAVSRCDRMPAALVCDYRLGLQADSGARDGLDAIRLLRHEFGTERPALLITADADSTILQRATDERVRVLRKPLEPQRLHQALVELGAMRQAAGLVSRAS